MSARDHHNHNAEGGFDSTRVAQALAKAVYDGDIVNFRLVFQPFSPARVSSNESFFMKKYAYLLPDEQLQQNPEYKEQNR